MAKSLTLEAAAELLGVRPAEIANVDHSPAGPVITTARDGVSYIDVAADAPDAAGKTGLMYASAPYAGYVGSFPVYQPYDLTPVAATGEGDEGEGGTAINAGSIADVLARVGEDPSRAAEAIAAENASTRPRARLLTKLRQITDAPASDEPAAEISDESGDEPDSDA